MDVSQCRRCKVTSLSNGTLNMCSVGCALESSTIPLVQTSFDVIIKLSSSSTSSDDDDISSSFWSSVLELVSLLVAIEDVEEDFRSFFLEIFFDQCRITPC